MMLFNIAIEGDNAAFDDDARGETARILRDVAQRIESGEDANYYRTIRDINGNRIGAFRFVDNPERLLQIEQEG